MLLLKSTMVIFFIFHFTSKKRKKSIAAFNTIHRQEEPGFRRMAIICTRGTKINAE
jgi:hypothetical protein